jgi:hypothetical protein
MDMDYETGATSSKNERGSRARQTIERFVVSHLICRYDGNSTQTSRFLCKLAIERLDER